jgi:ABC-type antimicrobial peptide transport system permease subunit
MAVGARPADVLRLILRQGLSCALVGVGIGLLASMGLARVIGRLLYGVSPTDLPTYAAVSVLWLSVALTACYLPARRAARVDPTVTLRYE